MRKSIWLGAFASFAIAGSALAQSDAKTVFQSRYDAFRTAVAAKDEAAIKATVAPDFALTDIRGGAHDVSGLTAALERMPAEMAKTAKTSILAAAFNGDSASVTQELSASIERAMPGSDKSMKLEMALVSDDTWVKAGDAWLLKTSVQKDLTVKRDGEVFIKQSK